MKTIFRAVAALVCLALLGLSFAIIYRLRDGDPDVNTMARSEYKEATQRKLAADGIPDATASALAILSTNQVMELSEKDFFLRRLIFANMLTSGAVVIVLFLSFGAANPKHKAHRETSTPLQPPVSR